jgi:hypothetical protein
MKTSRVIRLLLAGLLVFAASGSAMATDAGKLLYNEERDVYFGTTHGHSSWSIDAFGLGNQKAGPEDGYRFARGEVVSHMGGEKVQLKQPLDFFCMTDHSEMMGTAPMMLDKGSPVYNTPLAKLVRQGKATETFTQIAGTVATEKSIPGFSGPKLAASVWQKVVANAGKYNEPGRFTGVNHVG